MTINGPAGTTAPASGVAMISTLLTARITNQPFAAPCWRSCNVLRASPIAVPASAEANTSISALPWSPTRVGPITGPGAKALAKKSLAASSGVAKTTSAAGHNAICVATSGPVVESVEGKVVVDEPWVATTVAPAVEVVAADVVTAMLDAALLLLP